MAYLLRTCKCSRRKVKFRGSDFCTYTICLLRVRHSSSGRRAGCISVHPRLVSELGAGPSCTRALCFEQLEFTESSGCQALQVGSAHSKLPALAAPAERPAPLSRDRGPVIRANRPWWGAVSRHRCRRNGLGRPVTPHRAAAAPRGHRTPPSRPTPPRSPGA